MPGRDKLVKGVSQAIEEWQAKRPEARSLLGRCELAARSLNGVNAEQILLGLMDRKKVIEIRKEVFKALSFKTAKEETTDGERTDGRD